MNKIVASITPLLFASLLLISCEESIPDQEQPEAVVEFGHLPAYWVLNNYETHTLSNNNTLITNTKLDGSLGINFASNASLQIIQNDTIQATGDYTIYTDSKKIKLSELILAEGVEPTGVAKVLFPIISNNTVEVNELIENRLVITVPYSESSDIVAYFSKQ